MLIDSVYGACVGENDVRAHVRLGHGRVVDVTPARAEGAPPIDGTTCLSADGRVLVPAFVDAHVHLDKAFLLDASAKATPGLDAAIRAVASLRGEVTLDRVLKNAERAVRLLIGQGVTAARVHVEIDPSVGLNFIAMHRAVAETFADRIALQFVAFPQRGLAAAGMPALMEAAMAAGLDVVGGCPYVDQDSGKHLDFVFDLAERHAAPVDLHLDFSDDPGQSLLSAVAERTRARAMGGRVTIGHVTTLAAMSPELQAAALDQLAEAGIALVLLPATDLYLVGRGEPGTRSLAPLDRARAAGVRVAIANNNIRNPFAPFGNGSLVQAAWLTGIVQRAADRASRQRLFEAITSEPAAIVGLDAHGPVPGAAAHLALLDAESHDDALLLAAPVLATLRAGRLVHARAGPTVSRPVA